MKKAVMEELMLALLDHTKAYKTYTDALAFAIGSIVMQEGDPIPLRATSSRHKEEIHDARERNDHSGPLSTNLETLHV